jgi:hypothetical protein
MESRALFEGRGIERGEELRALQRHCKTAKDRSKL